MFHFFFGKAGNLSNAHIQLKLKKPTTYYSYIHNYEASETEKEIKKRM